jgi:hypothetical protein
VRCHWHLGADSSVDAEFFGSAYDVRHRYPNGLTRNEMFSPARMVAIANIFEALTASDYPYKKAKKVSE